MKSLRKMSLCGVCVFLMTGCSINIDEIEGRITDVKDGGTIILDCGLEVHLCGIDGRNVFCKEQLKTFVGKNVALFTDSEEEETIDSYDEEVTCYVRIPSKGLELNRFLLNSAGKKALCTTNCSDSLEAYRRIWSNPPILTTEQMCASMRAGSMLVLGTDGESSWTGTAFFINNKGLALSCDHVLNHGTRNRVCLSDSRGLLQTERLYSVNSVVCADKELDYVLFYVDLDEEELKNLHFLPLANKIPEGGASIGVVGNPLGVDLTMSFSSGTVSGYRPEMGKLQINAPITHGFSGGPVCNSNGEIVGVAQSVLETEDYGSVANLNFAVDIQEVRKWLDKNNYSYAGK